MKVSPMPMSNKSGPYAEGDEGGHVEDGDGAEGPRAPVDLLDDHQLPDVQEDGVELQDHADRRAPDVLPRVQAEIITRTCSLTAHSLVLSSHPTSNVPSGAHFGQQGPHRLDKRGECTTRRTLTPPLHVLGGSVAKSRGITQPGKPFLGFAVNVNDMVTRATDPAIEQASDQEPLT